MVIQTGALCGCKGEVGGGWGVPGKDGEEAEQPKLECHLVYVFSLRRLWKTPSMN